MLLFKNSVLCFGFIFQKLINSPVSLLNEDLLRLDDANKMKKDKKPLYKGLNKVASVVSPSLIFKEKNLGDQIGCIIIK